MNEHIQEGAQRPMNGSGLEIRSRALFDESVDGVDMRVRSRLTQARHAALEAAAASRRRPWFLRMSLWTPAAGVSAAAVLGVALWFGTLTGSQLDHHGMASADNQPNLEDLDMVASSDGSGDSMDMLQDDLDFYDFADKATNPGPAA